MKNRRILWTPQAKESLKETHRFILKMWGDDIAANFLDLVDIRISQITSHAEIAPKVQNTSYRRLIIHKHVSLFYINDDFVTRVLLFWDNRQDPKKLAKRLEKFD